MATDLDPIVGNWYQDLDNDAEFEVTAIDEDAGTVELRYFDGTREEIDLDDWYRMDIASAEPTDSWGDDEDEDAEDVDDDTDDDGWDADDDYNAPDDY